MAKKLSYKELQTLWYKKLTKVKDDIYPNGFQDIETDENNLKVWSTKFARKQSVDSWQAKAVYYNMADNFLNDYIFETKLEQVIWEYHANAISSRDIAKTLNKVRKKKTNHTTVWQTIKRLEQVMYRMYNMSSTDQ